MPIKHLSPRTREEILKNIKGMSGDDILRLIKDGMKFKMGDLDPYTYKFSALDLLELASRNLIKIDPKQTNKILFSIRKIKILNWENRILNLRFAFNIANITLNHKEFDNAKIYIGSFIKGGKDGKYYIGKYIDNALEPFGYCIDYDKKIEVIDSKKSEREYDWRHVGKLRSRYKNPMEPDVVWVTVYSSKIIFNVKQLPNKMIDVTKIVKSILE